MIGSQSLGILTAVLLLSYPKIAWAGVRGARLAAPPAIERDERAQIWLEGWIGQYLRGVSEQWLKIAPEANPSLIEIFRDRDRQPLRPLILCSGANIGKYLTAAVQVYRLTRDPELKLKLAQVVAELIDCQDADGYLGCWPKDCRLTGRASNSNYKDYTWDAWSHYHVMLGLLLWHQETQDRRTLECVQKMGDLFCQKFLNAPPGQRLVDNRSTMANLSPIHSLCLLYEATGTPRYLALAEQIAGEFEQKAGDGEQAGDFIRLALAGKDFWQTPQPRWESLHSLMGIVELYHITGKAQYRQAFEQLWRSIVKGDRHNNGGFSSGEAAQGNPYHGGSIETCCTIAWTAMTVEMLRLTGDSQVADELELTTLNSVTGMHSPTGRWVTYNTPMDGLRKASQHDIVFQSREGMPEINCCSVNGARGFGMISDWAVMRNGPDLVINWLGPCKISTVLDKGLELKIVQQSEFPFDGAVSLELIPARTAEFCLRVRIPKWSSRRSVRLNGQSIPVSEPGSYLTLRREWKKHDRVELVLDMSYHFWVGEKECAGKASLYRGPLLLAYDRRYNDMDPGKVPVLDASRLDAAKVKWDRWLPPAMLLEFATTDGRKLRLCDFASAGACGTPYLSWLPMTNVGKEAPQYFRP